MTAREIISAVRVRHVGVRLERPAVYGALNGLCVQSLAVSFDDPDFPRRWTAVPEDVR